MFPAPNTKCGVDVPTGVPACAEGDACEAPAVRARNDAREAVCAILVTFRPPPEVLMNIRQVREQVQSLIVVDNGSGRSSVAMLRGTSAEQRFLLIENKDNLGIAAALNIGIKEAAIQGYRWVILFDQDSRATPGFIDKMFAGMRVLPDGDKVAIFCPRYIDRASGRPMPSTTLADGSLAVARSSGSLMPMWVFERCGWFIEEMVIDQVDYEYCLRVRSFGYRIIECEAVLLHTLGKPKVHRLLGRRLFATTNHSAARRYYLVRNRVWLSRKHLMSNPRWCLEAGFATLKECAKIALVEDYRWSKLRYTFLGVRDGLIGRMGKTVEL
ncbi:MAG TPA: glycosyltransferase family 2 protein [Acidisarcina sp.]